MAGLYSYYLAPIVLTPAQVNIPQLVNTGNRLGGWLLVQNNSPYKIQVQLPGSGNSLPLDPQTVDKLAMNSGDTTIYILPLTLLPGAAPSSQVDIQVYPGDENEPPGTYPMALPRQTSSVPPATTGRGFTTIFQFSTTNTGGITLILKNPANSGKNMTIYQARIILSTAAGSPSVQFSWTKTDPAIGGGVAINPNDTLATSVMSTESSNNSSAASAFGVWESMILLNPLLYTYDFVPQGDQKQIPPGSLAFLNAASIPTGTTSGSFIIKHTEQ